MRVITIETKALGDRSYVVTDSKSAVVVDPQRDIKRVTDVLDDNGLELTHVVETHLHNDYVTGGLELARSRGAEYVLPAMDEVAFKRSGAQDGDEIHSGLMSVTAIHTPGHTPNHMSYLASESGQAVAVFTGGSMLYNSVGRTDLIGNGTERDLTRAQYRSVRTLGTTLGSDVNVYPTHGFGSFCSASATETVDSSTIGQQREHNLVFSTDDEDAFVKELLSGLSAYPRYYAHMSPINAAGPSPIDLSPADEVDPSELISRIASGEWVVDLRSRTAFAAEHVPGTFNLEATDSFATYLGWTIPWGTPVTLLGESAQQIVEAQTQMARIGIDRPAGAAIGKPMQLASGRPTASFETANFKELHSRSDLSILDVRRDDEWEAGHIAGAVHIPLHELLTRADEVPDGQVWVHCASGYRAAIAASMLDATGRDVVLVDDDWENAQPS